MVRILGILGVALLGAMMPQGAKAQSVIVDTSFAGGTVSWDGRGGGVLIRYRLIELDGEIFVCGAYARRGTGVSRRAGREMMRLSSVSIDGARLISNLQFFNNVSNSHWETDLNGVEATCRSTGDAYTGQALHTAQFNLPTGPIRVDR